MEQPKIHKDSHGTIFYYLPSKGIYHYHCLDGPAVVRADGSNEWYINGKRHRIDGPACEDIDGTRKWWVNGKRHRTNGPAVIIKDWSKGWYVNGKQHRTDGPAYVNTYEKEWWMFGKRHRIDGPAVERTDGLNEWWIDNIFLDEKVFYWLKENNITAPFSEQDQMAIILRWG